ncbi:unnamed protein product [Malus baccata var. baccata]
MLKTLSLTSHFSASNVSPSSGFVSSPAKISIATTAVFLKFPAASVTYISIAAVQSNHFSSLDFIDDSAGVKLLQSINGLVLGCSFYKLGKTISYYVCNPSTRQFLTLPPPNAKGHDSLSTILVVCIQNCSSSAANVHYQFRYTHPRLEFGGFLDLLLWPHPIWCLKTGCFGMVQYIGLAQQELHCVLISIKSASDQCLVLLEASIGVQEDSSILVNLVGICTLLKFMDQASLNSKSLNWRGITQGGFPDYLHPHPYDYLFYAFVLLFVQETEESLSLLLHIPGIFKEICDVDPKSTKSNTALRVVCVRAHQFIETLASV